MIKDGIQSIENNEIYSFLMIGQSNMAGRGTFDEVESIDNKMCYMLRNGKWQKMSEPVNPDRGIFEGTFHSGVSLGTSFADEYAKAMGRKIGLIPCADGGTKITHWMPGETLYDHAVCMTGFAKRCSDFAGILWHQGESDCNDEGVELYKDRFMKMITQLRGDLDAQKLPVIIGELSDKITERWYHPKYPRKMNEIFKEIAKEIPLCTVVSAKGLTLNSDGIHFNSKSLREFGKRYFEAYFSLINK